MMSKRLVPLVLAAAVAGCGTSSTPAPVTPSPELIWSEWTPELFPTAKSQGRLVLLDLGAVWCHWCHVMEETTYRDPEIRALLAEGWVPVRVDQAQRPDLAHRYEDYGWPATILFDGDGNELGRFRGYLEPARFGRILRAFRSDPTPGPSVTGSAAPTARVERGDLAPEVRSTAERVFRASYDEKHASWGTTHKFLQADNVEYALVRAADGDAAARTMAVATLDAQRNLLDPVWGGVYQYSHGGVWTNPHFEKIVAIQAGNLEVYAHAFAQLGRPEDRAAAESIVVYLDRFLTSPEGVFFASQDADVVKGEHASDYFARDDAGRRALGIPEVDQHVYARENGWLIGALARLGAVTRNRTHVDRALRAARWIVENRGTDDGGFRHDADDADALYLGDTLAMGAAFLALANATAEPEWIDRAVAAAGFIRARFTVDGQAGVATATRRPGEPATLRPLPQRDENVACARFANLLHHVTGDPAWSDLARIAMSWLAQPDVATLRPPGGVLLADRELAGKPVTITIVGPPSDARARALFAAAGALPEPYKVVEWWQDPATPRRNAEFPLPWTAPAAYVCANGACSSPVERPEEIAAAVARLTR